MKVEAPLHVVLVEPEIASNAGNVGRTCVAVGAVLWLVRPLGFRLDDRHLKRAGLDYWPELEYRVVDGLDEALRGIGEGRAWYFSTKAGRPYTTADYRPGDALVFGSEGKGLPASVVEAAGGRALRIPIRPEARSLNLANAVAIGVFEAIRPRGCAP